MPCVSCTFSMSQIPTVASILSASSSVPVSPMPSVTLADYQDISGANVTQPFSRSASVETKVAEEQAPEKTPSDETPTEPTEKDYETESETVESDEEPPAPEAKDDAFDFALGAGSIVLFGGILVAAISHFLSSPVIMQHPYNSRDYF